MKRTCFSFVVGAALAGLLGSPSLARAQTEPPLGTVRPFAVLGGSAVTAAGPAGTVISGNVGSAPTSTVNGFPPALVTAGFTVYKAADAVTASARSDATTAYNNLKAQSCPAANVIAGGILGGKNLVAGVYCMPTGDLTGTLTLTGGAADIWVFQMTLSTLTTAGASKVVMAGGASACNVYWQVSSSATLGAASTFSGSIFSGVSIGLGTTAAVTGRVIAGSGAVTMDGSDTVGGCSAPAACPFITLTQPASGTVGVPYSQQITASGGTAPYVFTSSALPAGLTLTAGGLLSGTPTAIGSATITATDGSGCPGTITFVVAAATCPVITLTQPPSGKVGVAYSQQITASGGTAPYVFSSGTGALPAGLTLTTGGLLSGTPTAAGSATITATDANDCPGVTTVLIAAATCPTITLTQPPSGTVGVAYSQQITASGGTGPYVFASSTLPAGLTLTSTGLLSGTPTAVGSATITATDANGCPGVTTVLIAAATCPTVTLTQPPSGKVGVAYSQQITASGGAGSYVFTSSTLPAGLTLTPGGLLSGTPTTVGSATITATDGNGCPGVITVLVVAATCPTITLTQPPAGRVGVAYSQQITASGGAGSYVFTSSTLPAGLTLTSSGLLSGTPTAPGFVTITATDGNGCPGVTTVTIATAVPSLPQAFVALLALALAWLGYSRLRRRARAE